MTVAGERPKPFKIKMVDWKTWGIGNRASAFAKASSFVKASSFALRATADRTADKTADRSADRNGGQGGHPPSPRLPPSLYAFTKVSAHKKLRRTGRRIIRESAFAKASTFATASADRNSG